MNSTRVFAFGASSHFDRVFLPRLRIRRRQRCETEAGLSERSLPSPIRLRRGPGAQCNRADLPEL